MSIEVTRHVATRAVAKGTEVIAFGDVHGASDLLEALLVAADGVERVEPVREVTYLGDLIDRGPRSVDAVGLALGSGRRLGATTLHLLAGNHDIALRVALDEAEPEDMRRRAWEEFRDNGNATIEDARRVTGCGDPRRALRTCFSDYLSRLAPWHRSGDVLFVHAGVNPRLDLDGFLATPMSASFGRAALDPDRHWAGVRGAFLRHVPDATQAHHGLFVVHGHSPRGRVDDASDAWACAHSRVNLDAGSAVTGRARMAVVRGRDVTLYEASRS